MAEPETVLIGDKGGSRSGYPKVRAEQAAEGPDAKAVGPDENIVIRKKRKRRCRLRPRYPDPLLNLSALTAECYYGQPKMVLPITGFLFLKNEWEWKNND